MGGREVTAAGGAPNAPRVAEAQDGVFTLPAGYVGPDGALHTEARLAPLTGFDEEFLTSMPGDVSSAAATTALLARSLRRVGSVEPAGDSLARGLLVCDREYLMLQLREMTFGPRVDAVLHCHACRVPMDGTFSLEELGGESRPAPARRTGARGSSSSPAATSAPTARSTPRRTSRP
jgi:hypothetical protein